MIQLLVNSIGTTAFVGLLSIGAYGIVYVWDRTLDKLFGIWNPLENIELETDEIA